MAKKKHKLTKKQRQKLLNLAVPILVILVSMLLGAGVTKLIISRNNSKLPNNIVWAADNNVKAPDGLSRFLQAQDKCQHYKGANSPKGVGLWGIYQVSGGKFAKIAYGCSWNLSSYIMAVKQGQKWVLLPPNEYFALYKDSPGVANGALPNCSQLEKYKIDKTIEPFCILPDGSAKTNEQN